MVSINETKIGEKCFPNNERIFEINFKIEDDNDDAILVEFKYELDIDISILIICKKYLEDKYKDKKVVLLMKYVPYSRMDRNIEGYMFSLKYFCQLINDLNFDAVYILDPHSNVTPALLNNCFELTNLKENIKKAVEHTKADYVFYPDAGASKRYSEILNLESVPYFYGNKKRDLKTGNILSYELIDVPDIQGKTILIVDDLCAKGFTFYNAGQKLKEQGAKNVILYVSHCENSIYEGDMIKSNYVDEIFTTDSILNDWSNKKIKNIELI